MNIRPAIPNDVQSMTTCVNAAYAHYIERIGRPPGPMLDDYAEMIRNHTALVAEIESQLAGLLILIEYPGRFLLDNVAVHPDFQGRGVGKQLLIKAEQIAHQRGFAEIQLYTHEKMVENVEIYGRFGYTEFDRRIEKGFSRIYMKKVLVKQAD
ncbi:MAG: GNAT family N-acetyltransferase [Chloroflexota bacterium]